MSKSSKGGEFERDISKYLTYWLTGKKKPLNFWRMPGSGGMATIDELNSDLSGDIRGITSEGMDITNVLSIEAKNGYPSTSFFQHFANIKNFNIRSFWIQCTDDAKKPNKHPMLIYKKKGRKPLVGINSVIDEKLKKINNDVCDLSSILLHWPKKYDLPDLIFYDMNYFFKIITPDDIRNINK